ncbi:hypothetical protein MMC25_005477 [Agyrium rufum]|nr:hypothetical protein [Agyrium rufum]
MSTSSDLFLALLAVLFPPLTVWIKRGLCSCDALLNILLCLLGYIPGLIHAWYIIAKYPDDYDEEEAMGDGNERGRYVLVVGSEEEGRGGRYVKTRGARGVGAREGQAGQAQRGYGTVEGLPEGSGRASAGAGPGVGGSSGQGGSSEGQAPSLPPPSYQEAVKGDHKVQR